MAVAIERESNAVVTESLPDDHGMGLLLREMGDMGVPMRHTHATLALQAGIHAEIVSDV